MSLPPFSVLRRVAVALVALAGLGGGSEAQPGPPLDAPLRFRHIDAFDGTGGVSTMHQDRLGFVWIGTHNGLWRYDGDQLRVFKPVPFDSTTLADPWVSALADDDEHGLWVATESGGLHHYDAHLAVFRRPLASAWNRVAALARRPDGSLWVGTAYDGLLDVRPAATEAGALRVSSEPPPVTETNLLLYTEHGDLWVGSWGEGLLVRRAGASAFRAVGTDGSLPDLRIRALHEDPSGRVWAGTRRGLVRYDPGGETFVPYLTGDPERDDVRAVLGDSSGTVWVGSSAGLERLDPRTGARTRVRADPRDPTSIAAGAVEALLLSRDGVLWVGGEFGVSYASLAPPPIGLLAHDPDDPATLGSSNIFSVYEDRAGVLWVGTAAGLDRVDRPSWRVTRYPTGPSTGLTPDGVGGIHEADDGSFWVATRPGGLHRFDRESGRVVEYFPPDLDSPGGQHSENPWWMLEDRRGRTWLTSGGPGCLQEFHRDSGTFTAHCHDPDDPNTPAGDFARNLIEARDGTLWLATWGQGLDRIDPETGAYTHYRHDPADRNTPPDDFILYLAEADDGRLWLGTYGGGLSRFDPATDTFEHFSSHSTALPDDNVYSVLPDGRGHVWVSTDNGLARLDPETGAVRAFGLVDGIQGPTFNSGASGRSASGDLFFGGPDGLNIVSPDDVAPRTVVAPVVVTGVEVGGDRVVPRAGGPLAVDAPYSEVVRLGPRERDVGFTFSALAYADRPAFRYRLEGYDERWQEHVDDLSATYTNLDPGRYTFRVQTASADGTWAEGGAALTVVVAPKWFETVWARLLGLLALLGAVALAVRRRERRGRETEARLEAEVAERTEALRAEKQRTEAQAERLREMDRLKSRLFTNVSHEFRTPLTLTIGPLEDLQREALAERPRRFVDLALRNSRRLLRLINQLLDVARLEAGELQLKAEPVDLGVYVGQIARSFAPLAERRTVTYEVVLPGTPLETYADPDKLEQVVGNLLSNAFKFTPEGGTIRVEVVEGDEVAEVRVRDSGPGIAAADLPRIFDRFYQSDETMAEQAGSGIGLSLAKDLAEAHGGTLRVESVEGFGSLFCLRLPLGSAHLEADKIARPGGPRHAATPPLPGPHRDADAGDPDDPELADDRTTLLIADDNADIRAYVREHLGTSYRILEAADGEAALALAKAETPDLIVSDVMMPGLDGLELVVALTADPETDFIPVILLTAKAEEAHKVAGLSAGADAYVTKPFNSLTLEAQIEGLIASRRRLRTRFTQRLASGESALPVDEEGMDSEDAAFVVRVRTAIEARLGDETVSVEDLAGEIGVSRSTLHRRLTGATGASPTTFLRETRLRHAAALLRDDPGSVSEIAYAVGFKSVSHFSQAYLRLYGVTPSASRRAGAARERA